jgi:hypothetical protein
MSRPVELSSRAQDTLRTLGRSGLTELAVGWRPLTMLALESAGFVRLIRRGRRRVWQLTHIGICAANGTGPMTLPVPRPAGE